MAVFDASQGFLKSPLGSLIDKLRREELIPLGSRIRTRLATEHASREDLIEGLAHLLTGAGNATLMTQQLRHTLCDHAAGNYRILTTMAAELPGTQHHEHRPPRPPRLPHRSANAQR